MDDILSRIQSRIQKKEVRAPSAPSKPVQTSRGAPTYSLIANEKDVKDIFSKGKNYEVEIGFGKFIGNRFVPGVTQGEFEALYSILSAHKTPETKRDIVEIDENVHIRKITSGIRTIYQKKTRDPKKIENRIWGYRISSSSEEQIKPPTSFNTTLERKRKRFSFDLDDMRIDMTQVTSKDKIIYEVEIERVPDVTTNTTKIKKAIEMVLFGLAGQNPRLPIEKYIATQEEKLEAIREHNKLLKRHEKDIYRLAGGYWNKPQNIKKDDILLSALHEFSVTVKLDGKRRSLLITKNAIYECGPPFDIKLVTRFNSSKYQDTLLDVETLKDIHHAFDIVIYKGDNITGENFKQRLQKVSEITKGLDFKSVVEKRFIHGNFYDITKQAFKLLKETEKSGISTDGLIYQPKGPYKNKNTRKWKPANKLTIDFAMKKLDGNSKKYLLQVASYRGNVMTLVPFEGSAKNILPKGFNRAEVETLGMIELDGLVGEFSYKNGNFVLERLREDKGGVPNEINVAASVWDDIVEPLSKDTLMGKDLLILRRLHNLCKMGLLKQNFKKGDTLMDWGSGRGGDLQKWNKLGISKVYTVEPNKDNYKILEDRMKEMDNFKTDIIHIKDPKTKQPVGGENTNALKSYKPDADGLVSFFSLTFFGKDMEMFDKGIESIDFILSKEGSKFVGMVMDSEKVNKCIENEECENDAFSITEVSPSVGKPKKGENEIEIVINDETSMVDQKEWLFYFDLFSKKLKSKGIALKHTGFLSKAEDFPKIEIKGEKYGLDLLVRGLSADAQVFNDLNRYFVFERVKGGISSSPKEKTWEKVKVKDGDFINAVLQTFDSKYKDAKRRQKRIKDVRLMLAGNLTEKMFRKLAGGCVLTAELEGLVYDLSEDDIVDDEDLDRQAYISFIERLADPKEKIDYRAIDKYVSDLLKINIHVVKSTKNIKTGGPYKKSIYLYNKKGIIYILSREGKTIFNV